MANLSKASNVVQEKYILYDVTGFTQKWHSIPVATNCTANHQLNNSPLRPSSPTFLPMEETHAAWLGERRSGGGGGFPIARPIGVMMILLACFSGASVWETVDI